MLNKLLSDIVIISYISK